MTGVAEAVYARMPRPLQDLGVNAYGYFRRHQRLAGRFQEYRGEYAAHERFSAEDWEAWTGARLREMLQLAARAPHYRRAFADAGVEPGDLARLELAELGRLPLTSKDDLRRDAMAFCPGGAAGRGARAYSTSGSTGTPVVVHRSNEDLRRWYALVDARYEGSTGVTYADPRATFSGKRVTTDDQRGPFHRYNRAERQVYFSPYHLRPDTVAAYVEALWKHRPRWLTGYAGSIHELARLAGEAGLECPPLDAVITSAEPVTARMREDVTRAFGCRLTEEYGLIEGVCYVLECPEGSLHCWPDGGIVEVLDERGEPCAPGEVGEIVATGMIHETQVLIRYRTRDLGTWAEGPCRCGRTAPVLAGVEGRVDDAVVLRDGRRIRRLTAVARDLPGVVAMQFVQHAPDGVTARVVSEGPLADDVRDRITERLAERLGPDVRIDVERVDALERTERGKVRGVISAVPTD